MFTRDSVPIHTINMTSLRLARLCPVSPEKEWMGCPELVQKDPLRFWRKRQRRRQKRRTSQCLGVGCWGQCCLREKGMAVNIWDVGPSLDQVGSRWSVHHSHLYCVACIESFILRRTFLPSSPWQTPGANQHPSHILPPANVSTFSTPKIIISKPTNPMFLL